MKRPFELYLLCLLLAILSLNGLVAGMLMLICPDGSLLQLNTEWLAGSPFRNYLLPGCLLFSCIGVLPLLSLIGLLFRPAWSWPGTFNIYRTVLGVDLCPLFRDRYDDLDHRATVPDAIFYPSADYSFRRTGNSDPHIAATGNEMGSDPKKDG